MYVLEPNQRTVSNFGNIIGELKERLHRWTRGGQYGFLFDNAEDTLSFKSFQTFNFPRLERCAGGAWSHCCFMFCIAHRMRSLTRRSSATFKTLPARRGVALHQERDHPQLRGAGAEDLAQAQSRDDPGDAIHQRA
jgi:hypothetical protein